MASASGDGGQGAAGAYCATCGRPLTMGLVSCPNCGTPVLGPTSPASWGTQAAPGDPTTAYQGHYLTPGMTPPAPPAPPAMGGGAQPWASAPTAASAVPATWQPVAPLAPRRGRRGVIFGTIGAVVILSLLATGVAYVMGAFAAHTELDAAKYLPANTVFFGGLDVVNLATNSHGIKQEDLPKLTGIDSSLQSSGLDLQADVMPWLGRDIAVGVFPGGAQTANPAGDYSSVMLLQSHDDGKALAAMRKAANHQSPDQYGAGTSAGTVTTSNDNGFTLYTQPRARYDDLTGTTVSDPNGTTFAEGKGWALVASSPTAAKTVIDRVNGSGDTLAAQKAFIDATGNVPSDRFGTLYVNISALADQLSHATAGMIGASGTSLQQMLGTYPSAVGYLSWTDSGLHAQITAKAAKPSGIAYPSGDTLALAKAAPSNAYAYVALNNLGGNLTASQATLGQSPQTAQVYQMVESFLGTSLSDPALAQPAALAIYPTSSSAAGIGGALLLKADPSAASSLVAKFTAAQQCTTKALTVDGQDAQALVCPHLGTTSEASVPPQTPATGDGSADATTTTVEMVQSSGPTIYVAQAGGALIVAADQASLAPAIKAAKGEAQSLAQAGTFQVLSAKASDKAQVLAFADVNALLKVSGVQTGSGSTGNLFERTGAVLVTTAADSTQSTLNIDVKLNG